MWTYSLDNSLDATEALDEGDVVTETYTARVTDEFGAYVDQTITVTINGTNDVPVVSNDAAALAGSVTEAGSEDDGSAVAGTSTVSGTLSATDVDDSASQTWTIEGTPSTTYGTIAIAAETGVWTYSLDNSLDATEALDEGDVVTETYTARVTDEFGAYVDQTITVTINGTNDVPVVSNDAAALAGSVTEAGSEDLHDGSAVAGTSTVSGTLSATDVDDSASQTWTIEGTPSTTYGTIAIAAETGVWTYSLDNSLDATEALDEGDVVTETYTARVTDEFGAYVDQTITVTINGTNDVPVVSNDAAALAGSVTEAVSEDDGSAVAGTSTVSGTLSATDVDDSASQTWTIEGTPSTTYGTIAIAAETGVWTYSLDNSLDATEALDEGDVVTETYTARVTDEFGAYVDQTITVTINGTNDVPVVSNDAAALAGSVTEAGSEDDGSAVAGTSTVSGTLSATDVDDSASQTWTIEGTPSTTYGTIAIAAETGVWTYSLDNSLDATEALDEGEWSPRPTPPASPMSSAPTSIRPSRSRSTEPQRPDVPVVSNDAAALAGSVTEAGSEDDGSARGTSTVSGTLSATDVDDRRQPAWTIEGRRPPTAPSPSPPRPACGPTASTTAWTRPRRSMKATETYTARVTDEFGAYVDQTITVTINGTNDVPVVSNDAAALAGSVTEAGLRR